MTRRDYIEVARIIRDAQDSPHEPPLAFVTRELALMFKRDNPNFKAGKFFEAAGMPELTGTRMGLN